MKLKKLIASVLAFTMVVAIPHQISHAEKNSTCNSQIQQNPKTKTEIKPTKNTSTGFFSSVKSVIGRTWKFILAAFVLGGVGIGAYQIGYHNANQVKIKDDKILYTDILAKGPDITEYLLYSKHDYSPDIFAKEIVNEFFNEELPLLNEPDCCRISPYHFDRLRAYLDRIYDDMTIEQKQSHTGVKLSRLSRKLDEFTSIDYHSRITVGKTKDLFKNAQDILKEVNLDHTRTKNTAKTTI